MNEQLYRCKYYPKEGDEYKKVPCKNCEHLTEFIHCDVFSYKENQDLYKRSKFLNKKVYCSECQYFETETGYGYAGEITWCSHPDNKFDTYRYPKYITKHPSELNKNNDCKWFKVKD